MKQAILTSILSIVFLSILAQDDLPQDYFSKEFHAGRRDAARQMMPSNSVMIVFAYPERNYSNDVSYLFHQNPDMYYFTGYKEPNSMLLIFKDVETSTSFCFQAINATVFTGNFKVMVVPFPVSDCTFSLPRCSFTTWHRRRKGKTRFHHGTQW